MKSNQITVMARALLLGSVACVLISSCAMSEQEAGKRGSAAGAVVGAAGGYFLGKKHGRTKGDRVKGALVGGVAGASGGKEVGKRTSVLKGLEDVILAR